MLTTRRDILGLAGSLAGSLLACPVRAASSARVETDRLLEAGVGSMPGAFAPAVYTQKYIATATITLLSVPVFSRTGVGSGYAVIEEAACPAGTLTSIQFAAGSWPECARG